MAVKSAKNSGRPVSGSVESPPLVIRQSRHQSIYWLLCGGAVLGLGLSGAPGQNVIGGLVPASLGITYAGCLLLLLSAIVWARAGRITISSAGLRYRLFLGSRIVRWGEIAGVHTRATVRGKPNGVSITLSTGQPLRLTGHWPVSRDELDRVIRQARREWGR